MLSPEVTREAGLVTSMTEMLGGPSQLTLGSASVRSRRHLAAAAKAIAEAHNAKLEAAEEGRQHGAFAAGEVVGEPAAPEQAGAVVLKHAGDKADLPPDGEIESDVTITWVQQPSLFRASLRRRRARPTIHDQGVFDPEGRGGANWGEAGVGWRAWLGFAVVSKLIRVGPRTLCQTLVAQES